MGDRPSMTELALAQGVRLDLSSMPLKKLDMSRFFFGEVNLENADMRGATLRGADFRGARLAAADLRGADLTDARNLTPEQLAAAVIDDTTILPGYIDRDALLALKAGRQTS